ncbi:MAG: putative DNA binding domain-containing protein [Acidobacteria bacterium]|nr:putative DNA binding domain-containing protein [Acidobacteriota bacterium]
MLTVEELERLMADLESDQVERKASLVERDKIRQAICAFANDLPGHRSPGYLFVGVNDAGLPTSLLITDELLRTLADMRSDGNILPIPTMTVQKVTLRGSPVAVVEVYPSDTPPVRFKGQVWIRVGPRRAIATLEEERRLTERQVAGARTFDQRPCAGATINDLLLNTFRIDYLPRVVDRGVISENNRTVEEQLASLRFFDLRSQAPTHAGVLVFGADPLEYLPGAYIQLVRFDGETLADPVQDEKQITGNLLTQLTQLDSLLPLQIHTARVPATGLHHEGLPDYPMVAIREFALNSVMHRTYEGTNAPVRINWFANRVEMQNPGGLYGQVTEDNYERVSDYRNPVIAEAMKALGYVERFGTGIARAKAALSANGNQLSEFRFEPTHVLVTVWRRP